MKPLHESIAETLAIRFGETVTVPRDTAGLDEIQRIAAHSTVRRYRDEPVAPELLRLLFAAAMSAPSKSDLQQADIVHVSEPAARKTFAELIPDMPWVAQAPVLLIFCANNRRIHQIGEWRGIAFANDHLDHFMNAAVDAGIAMTTFIRAAEAVGLGCCPISAVRNHCGPVSELLGLPDWVFPVAGLCVGWPQGEPRITPRLPLSVTVHTDRFREEGLEQRIDEYDRRRHELQPYAKQRGVRRWGPAAFYGWSEDKARQYGVPERADFGAFIRSRKFNLV